MKKRKLLLIVGLSLVVLIAVLLVTLRSLLPPEKVLALVEPRLEAALGREVEIGKASFRFWPLGVRLQSLKVKANPGYSSPLLLELGALRFDLRFLPLLRRAVDVRSLVLEDLRLELEQDAQGRWNFASSPVAQATPSTRDGGSSSPLALRVRSLSLQDGAVQLRLAQRNVALTLPVAAELSLDLDRSLENMRVRGWIESSGITGNAGGRPLPELDLRLEPDLHADLVAQNARIDALRLQLQEFAFEMEGNAALQGGKPVVQLHTRSNSFELEELLALVPERAQALQARGSAQLDLSIDVPASGSGRVDGSFSLERGSLRAAEWPAALENIQLHALLAGDSLEVSRFDAELAGSPIHLQGTVRSLLNPSRSRYDIHLQTQLALASLSPLLQRASPAAASLNVQGNVEADLRARGALANRSLPDLQGPIRLHEVRLKPPALSQPLSLEASLLASGTQVKIESARATSGDTQLDATGTLFLALPPESPRLVLRAQAPLLDLETLLVKQESTPPPGHAKAPADSSNLVPQLPPLRLQLDLETARARMQEAELRDARLTWRSDARQFELDLQAQSLQQSDLTLRSCQGHLEGTPTAAQGKLTARSGTLGKIQATDLQGDLRLHGAQVELTNVRARTYEGSLQGNITVDLSDRTQPRQRLDLNMQEVQLGGLMSDLFRAGGLVVGTLSGKSTWNAAGSGATAIRKQLSGAGEGFAVNGRLREMPLLTQLSQLLGVPSLAQLQYKEIGFEFTVEEGQVRLPQMQLLGSDADARVDGSIGLDGGLALGVNLKLSEALTRQALQRTETRALGKLFTDSEGRLVLDFDIGGSLRAPKVRADLQATAARSGLRSLGEQELKRLLDNLAPQSERTKEEVGRSLKDAVRGLFEPKQAKKDSTAKP